MVDLTPEEMALAAELPPSEWAAASDHVEAWCAAWLPLPAGSAINEQQSASLQAVTMQ